MLRFFVVVVVAFTLWVQSSMMPQDQRPLQTQLCWTLLHTQINDKVLLFFLGRHLLYFLRSLIDSNPSPPPPSLNPSKSWSKIRLRYFQASQLMGTRITTPAAIFVVCSFYSSVSSFVFFFSKKRRLDLAARILAWQVFPTPFPRGKSTSDSMISCSSVTVCNSSPLKFQMLT